MNPLMNQTLTIDKLGQRGEGIAAGDEGQVFVPYALAGETVTAEVHNERGRLVEILEPSPDRIPAFCPHYGICGGCAVQALAAPAYAEWKRGLVVAALAHAGAVIPVAPLIDAHGEGRRRATFHARFARDERGAAILEVGFMRAREHAIVDIEACPVLAPSMAGAVAAARAVASALKSKEKPLDIVVTATLNGLDIDVRGAGKLDFTLSQKLVAAAAALDIARISNHGETIIERRAPALAMGRAGVILPAGAFLQATSAGEAALAALAQAGIGKSKSVADLFAGVGTFALRLAETAAVHAVETDAAMLGALERAAHEAPGLRRVTIETRDLFRRPLLADELNRFDAVVFDPPRSGAESQAKQLAASAVPVVIAFSCNVQTLSRDAKILLDGGYACDLVTPVDQFRHSPHVEMAAVFRRAKVKAGRRGRLLG